MVVYKNIKGIISYKYTTSMFFYKNTLGMISHNKLGRI